MAKTKSNKFSDLTWKVVTALLIASLIGLATFLFPGGWGPVLKWVWSVVTTCISWFFSMTEIPVWLLCVLTLLAIIGAGNIYIGMRGRYQAEDKNEPHNMTFLDAVWTWKVNLHGGVTSLCSFCPQCDYQIYARGNNGSRYIKPLTQFRCENCGWESRPHDFPIRDVDNIVIRKIQQNIRRRYTASQNEDD